MNRNWSESMNTQINTIGRAVVVQTLVRYAAYFALLWLILSFADGWIMAWIASAGRS